VSKSNYLNWPKDQKCHHTTVVNKNKFYIQFKAYQSLRKKNEDTHTWEFEIFPSKNHVGSFWRKDMQEILQNIFIIHKI